MSWWSGKATPFSWRTFYRSIHSVDGHLKVRRERLWKKASMLDRKRKSLIRKIEKLKSSQQDYDIKRRQYQHLVRAVERKLQFTHPESFESRQKKLNILYSELKSCPPGKELEL